MKAGSVPHSNGVQPETPVFKLMGSAMFAAGFTTFGLLYYVQSLLPLFAETMQVTPTQSSLALSLTTGLMAFSLLFVGAISDTVGRKKIMTLSLVVSSCLTIVMAFSPNWNTLLVIRLLMGISLSGVQSVSMAYLAEELDPKSLASAIGLFIAGSALGGMFGRTGASMIADLSDWRTAVACMGGFGLAAAFFFQWALPPSRHFSSRSSGFAHFAGEVRSIFRDTVLLRLFLLGFAIMSCFVTTFNFIAFRLVASPFELSQTAVGLVFLLYVFGSFGATISGRLVTRFGRGRIIWATTASLVIGILLTLPNNLAAIVIGLSLLTFGMFSTHSIASSWVSVRARSSKAMAASFYLFAYYQGGSLIGAGGGWFWEVGGWPSIVLLTVSIGLMGVFIGLTLRRTEAPISSA